jgi:chemotaxis protein MotA
VDLATLIGMLGAFGVVTYSVIKTDQLPLFTEDLFSPIFVLSGTMLGVMIRFSLGHFFSSLKVVAKTFSNSNDDPQSLIDEIVQLATVSRKDGLLALEKIKISEEFLEEGVQMLIDGSNPEVVKQSMSKNMRGILERNTSSEKVWRLNGRSITRVWHDWDSCGPRSHDGKHGRPQSDWPRHGPCSAHHTVGLGFS